ncbi:isochorismatase family protein [Planosporangium thailandense]|uniref:Isochorismatase family protein n=1 Tax=Planosporangium thailandense TaxID=765197 RepID=A0ABX0Y1W8_9ACTN|nr:isochorismatase family protein [Planosporangium thailandense]NJC71424.1 isochorismatase family protein [Planosporangium thailandense]
MQHRGCDVAHIGQPHWPWDGVVSDADQAVCRAAGYGRRSRFTGTAALLIVDMTYAFVGLRAPIHTSIAEYPNSCGEAAWDAVDAVRQLLDAARRAGAPVAYTVDVSATESSVDSVWRNKQQPALRRRADETEIVHEIRPLPGDIVVTKTRPSGFFGTDLLQQLRDRGVRTLVVCGGTTSGCVRATVVDAFSHGFNVAVALDGVFDRVVTSHAVNLFDLNAKYCDVLQQSDALGILTGRPAASPEIRPTQQSRK